MMNRYRIHLLNLTSNVGIYAIACLVCLFGCTYYPPNFVPKAFDNGSHATFTNNLSLGGVRNDVENDGEYLRIPSFLALDTRFRLGDFHLSPSLFAVGAGAGVGYIFQDKATVSTSFGFSVLPDSYGGGTSVSYAFTDHIILGYSFNYGNFTILSCAGGCWFGDTDRFDTYQHFSVGGFFPQVSFFLENSLLVDLYVDFLTDKPEGYTIGASWVWFRPLFENTH